MREDKLSYSLEQTSSVEVAEKINKRTNYNIRNWEFQQNQESIIVSYVFELKL